MKDHRSREFAKWYMQEQKLYQITSWVFQENLVGYCKADVTVLPNAPEIYDTLMKEFNDDISPLTNITLAS